MDLESRDIAPGSAILHVTVTGDMSIKVEGQSEEQTLQEIMKELRKVYGSNIPDAKGRIKVKLIADYRLRLIVSNNSSLSYSPTVKCFKCFRLVSPINLLCG